MKNYPSWNLVSTHSIKIPYSHKKNSEKFAIEAIDSWEWEIREAILAEDEVAAAEGSGA